MRAQPARIQVAERCCKHGVRDATIYKWKARFGSMEVSEAKRLRALEDEDGTLKRMRADAVVDDCTRECLTLAADTSLSGACVARELAGRR